MAKASVAFIASALVVLAIATSSADCAKQKEFNITITGSVSCDPCRLPFPSRLRRELPGVLVRLNCHAHNTLEDVYPPRSILLRTRTDQQGRYLFTASGVREIDVCTVETVHSPDARCNHFPSPRHTCTVSWLNADEPSFQCDPENLYFWTEKADPKCIDELNSLTD